MARKAVTKKARSTSTPAGASAVKARSRRSTRSRAKAAVEAPSVPRATLDYDEDDVLMSGGTVRGVGYGRCGGRVLSSKIEQSLCDKLSRAGITHSHSPRHFEVELDDGKVAAYAPMVVLRGRGREGKTVVIEAASETQGLTLSKIAAFRRRLGPEFYVIFVAPEEIIDDVPLAVYDESCTTNDLDTLVGRLTD